MDEQATGDVALNIRVVLEVDMAGVVVGFGCRSGREGRVIKENRGRKRIEKVLALGIKLVDAI